MLSAFHSKNKPKENGAVVEGEREEQSRVKHLTLAEKQLSNIWCGLNTFLLKMPCCGCTQRVDNLPKVFVNGGGSCE